MTFTSQHREGQIEKPKEAAEGKHYVVQKPRLPGDVYQEKVRYLLLTPPGRIFRLRH